MRRRDIVVYLDACVYLAHYRQEISSYGETRINAIRDILNENKAGGASIVTSSLTICEVQERLMQSNMSAEINDFNNLFRFGLHSLKDVDPKVAEKAAEYRHFYRINPLKRTNRDKPYVNLATPDAIHLATAVLNDCDEFWTMDGLNPSSDRHESIKPLWLNNKVGNDSIVITAPAMQQGSLPLGVEAQPNRRFKLGE